MRNETHSTSKTVTERFQNAIQASSFLTSSPTKNGDLEVVNYRVTSDLRALLIKDMMGIFEYHSGMEDTSCPPTEANQTVVTPTKT